MTNLKGYGSWLAILALSQFVFTTLAQSNSTNTTVTGVPYSAYFDTEVYSDGAGVEASKNLNNPTVVAINVPEGENRTDLFFHFSASADKHAWAGFGLGSEMSEALMFVVYRSEAGPNNVTVSPRTAGGHSMPQHTTDVQIHTLDLTGIDENNRFVVNMQCLNCRKWNSGSLQLYSNDKKEQPVFYAFGPDGDLASDDLEAPIQQHERVSDVIGLDLVPGEAGVPIIPDDPSEPRTATYDFGNGSSSAGSSSTWTIAIHALLMCFAFSIVFPGGYLLLRIFEKVWLHWIPQSAGVLVVLGGLGAGVAIPLKGGPGKTWNNAHQIMGFIVTFLVLCTWTLGFVGHRIYNKTSKSSMFIHVHRLIGPIAILLGVTNACLGFLWAGVMRRMIGYIIFNVFVVVIVASLVLLKRKRAAREAAAKEGVENGYAMYNVPPPEYSTGQGMAPNQYR